MEISDDFRSAKHALSSRLLHQGLRGGVVGMLPSLRVLEASANAGHNVHAVGVGRKTVAGKPTKDTCIRVHVVQKLAASLLSGRDVVPREIDGIPTDVVESPPAFVLARKAKAGLKTATSTASSVPRCSTNRRQRQRPVVGGISAAHFGVTAGTIACFCRSTREADDPSTVYVLSNNHVFANVNQASLGDDLYQPGPMDGGTAQDYFGDLARFVPISIGGIQGNKVDAAIGTLHPGVPYRTEICSIGSLSGTKTATVDTKVRKHGRTTGYTEGEVSDDAYDALVGLDHSNQNIVGLFEDQFRIEATPPYAAIGLGGDSGSLVVHRKQNKAVGLYFAGPQNGSYGIANHIGDVLNELKISLL